MGNRSYPESFGQLTEAVAAAVFSLALDAAWQYNLIKPDPKVNVERCQEIIAEAAARGMTIPSLEEVLSGKGN